MTPQERDLTTILLDRLNKTEGQKDPEAEATLVHVCLLGHINSMARRRLGNPARKLLQSKRPTTGILTETATQTLSGRSRRRRPPRCARSAVDHAPLTWTACGSQWTRRWREMDSNPRSPGYGGALCFWARATRPTYRPPGCPLGGARSQF